MPIRHLLHWAALLAALWPAGGAGTEAPGDSATAAAPTWAGTYIGAVPSPFGDEARMVLVLDQGGRYQMMHDGRGAREVYAAQSQGPIRWEDGRTTLRLGSGQRFRLSEGAAELLPSAGKDAPATRGARLVRQLRFTGPDGELLVDPASLRLGQPQPGWLSFTAIWNLLTPAANGARSLAARFELYCVGDSYRLGELRGFSQAYLRGQPLVTAQPDTPRATPGTLAGQVAHRHCPR